MLVILYWVSEYIIFAYNTKIKLKSKSDAQREITR